MCQVGNGALAAATGVWRRRRGGRAFGGGERGAGLGPPLEHQTELLPRSADGTAERIHLCPQLLPEPIDRARRRRRCARPIRPRLVRRPHRLAQPVLKGRHLPRQLPRRRLCRRRPARGLGLVACRSDRSELSLHSLHPGDRLRVTRLQRQERLHRLGLARRRRRHRPPAHFDLIPRLGLGGAARLLRRREALLHPVSDLRLSVRRVDQLGDPPALIGGRQPERLHVLPRAGGGLLQGSKARHGAAMAERRARKNVRPRGGACYGRTRGVGCIRARPGEKNRQSTPKHAAAGRGSGH